MPSALRDARACKRTQPFPKYISDGSGRDLTMTFQRDPLPPKFNHFFNDNRPEKLAKEMKTFQAKIHTTARFVPNGSGRDLFQQVNEDYVFPISTSFSPIEKTSQKSHFAQNRPKSVPRYVPTGSGRDLYLTDLDASRCASPLSFKISKPNASNLNVLRARTSPPPRFVATGLLKLICSEFLMYHHIQDLEGTLFRTQICIGLRRAHPRKTKVFNMEAVPYPEMLAISTQNLRGRLFLRMKQ